MDTDSAQARLEVARRDLLDLGLRNPLLNYRPLRARGVTIVDERPPAIYRHLVTQGKAFSFLAADNTGTPPEPGGMGQPQNQAAAAARHHDDWLQTPYGDHELQKRLLRTHDAARDYIAEQGVNVLYLALGMLHWRETGAKESLRHAPLVLVPVRLFRPHINSRFQLGYTGADVGANLPLRTKLALDFDLSLPALPEQDDHDLPAYWASVQQAVRSMSGWQVDETAVTLGFFSFSKFLMYHDLDAASWEGSHSPASHPVLRALLADQGFIWPGEQLGDDAAIDDHIDLSHSHQVVDADSSQTLALLDVRAGHNLVIQGPPGTGKSQTITNLIASALGNGQTVLFVAEKMAALEVVKRRLDEAGLGDACLELHSHKTTKSSVAAELRRTLQLGQPKADGRFPQLAALQTTRDHLNAYSQSMNEPIAQSGVTLFQAYGSSLQLRALLGKEELPPMTISQLSAWSAAEFEQRLAQTDTLQQVLVQIGVPSVHPLWGSACQDTSPDLPDQIRRLARLAVDTLQQLLATAAALAALLETPLPETTTGLKQLQFAAQRLHSAPKMIGVDTTHPAWTSLSESLLAALAAGAEIRQARDHFDEWLIPEAWTQDVLAIRRNLMAGRSRWRRPFSPTYRRARALLAGLCRQEPPEEWTLQLGALDAILQVQRVEPVLAEMTPHLTEIFGLQWRGAKSNWSELLNISGWLANMHEAIRQGIYPDGVLRLATQAVDKTALQQTLTLMETAWETYETAVTALQEQLQFDPTPRFGPEQTVDGLPLSQQEAWLQGCHTAADTIDGLATYNHLAAGLATTGLQAMAPVATHWRPAAAHLGHLLQWARSTALIERAHEERGALRGLHEQSPDVTVDQFQDLDMQYLAHNRVRLAQAHWQQLPRHAAGGNMGLLQAEVQKKRNHMPIRRLLQTAGDAIRRIKPVFMMSPLSIATYLPPDGAPFDLVIFDEASQVRPVDAFGAILRGKQVVVVGDSRQLPPTTFFARLLGDEEETGAGIEQESILDLFTARNAPQRMLRWHYRSRHESLIAVSNEEFYQQQLVIFPSPDAMRQELGLRYHYLPNTVYLRGKSRTNPQEAEAVAQAVMVHARQNPELTLGVVAFSRGQQEAIRHRLEGLRRQDAAAEPFFRRHPIEPFFVKNLENVQGDERDVIFISVGYGRDADGQLTMNFGPLNQAGGERRLNVLITRARQRCEVFTNLTPEDIELRRTQARGVAALQRYLHFARTGEMADRPPESDPAPGPFIDMVTATLRQHGHVAVPRVGSGSVRVDVALLDAENGRYTLGIECDGDNYHLARSARDRDRIQAQVLRRLGWRLHRVWSRQWWLDADGEKARLLAAIAAPPPAEAPDLRFPAYERYDARAEIAEKRPVPAYKMAAPSIDLRGNSFYKYYAAKVSRWRLQLIGCMMDIVQQEGPVHREEMMRRMSYAAGYQMLALPDDVAQWLIEHGQETGRIIVRGDYLWPVAMKRPPVRDRGQLPPVSRKFGYIAPQEIEEAVLLVVADSFGIEVEEIPLRVGRLFGFRQLGNTSKEAVGAAVARLLSDGRLRQRRSQVIVM